jgi:hypothetical protein
LSNGEEVKKDEKVKEALTNVVNSLSQRYTEIFEKEKKYFDDLKASQDFKTLTEYTLPVIPKVAKWSSPPTVDVEQKKVKIKDLYSNQNLNTDTTFNGKVTFL